VHSPCSRLYRSSCCDKHNCQRRDSNLDPLTPQSDALTTRLLRPVDAPIVDAPSEMRNAPLIRLLTSALYCLLVYIVCFPTSPFFFTFFLTYLFPYSYFPSRIDALRFQAGCRKRRLNLYRFSFYRARRYASAGTSYGPVSVCLSQVGVLSKRMDGII